MHLNMTLSDFAAFSSRARDAPVLVEEQGTLKDLDHFQGDVQ